MATKKPAPKKETLKKPAAARISRSKGDKIAIFIDLDNTGASVLNVQEIISILKNTGNLAYGKLYGVSDSRSAEFDELVRENKLETAGISRYQSTVDLRLVMDALELCEKNKFDAVFVWLGACDLMPFFVRLSEMKLKTLTLDLPSIDTKNKFVTQALKLYSPIGGASVTSARPAPVQVQTQSPAKTQASQATPTLQAQGIPQLPRKKGAPEFGARENSSSVDTPEERQAAGEEEEPPMSDDEYRAYMLRMLKEVVDTPLESLREEDDSRDEFDNLNKYDSEEAPVAKNDTVTETSNFEDDSSSFTGFGDDFGSLNR